jgi:hypothetical protein
MGKGAEVGQSNELLHLTESQKQFLRNSSSSSNPKKKNGNSRGKKKKKKMGIL